MAGILPLNSWARLGETPEQCEERYGTPNKTKKEPAGSLPGTTLARYQKAGLEITVLFYVGKAAFIVFQKPEENAYGNANELSLPEIEVLLKANGGGKKWQVIPRRSGLAWVLDDESALALYADGPNFLTIQTAEYEAAEAANRRAKDEENLNGF